MKGIGIKRMGYGDGDEMDGDKGDGDETDGDKGNGDETDGDKRNGDLDN